MYQYLRRAETRILNSSSHHVAQRLLCTTSKDQKKTPPHSYKTKQTRARGGGPEGKGETRLGRGNKGGKKIGKRECEMMASPGLGDDMFPHSAPSSSSSSSSPADNNNNNNNNNSNNINPAAASSSSSSKKTGTTQSGGGSSSENAGQANREGGKKDGEEARRARDKSGQKRDGGRDGNGGEGEQKRENEFNPRQEIVRFDWPDLERRYAEAMAEHDAAQAAIHNDFRKMMNVSFKRYILISTFSFCGSSYFFGCCGGVGRS